MKGIFQIKLIIILVCCFNAVKSQNGSFYFWACQGSTTNTGNTCSTPNYTSATDASTGSGVNPGCYNLSYSSSINGGVFTNQNGSGTSPYSPVNITFGGTFNHRISVNFTSSNSTTSNATVTYSFTQSGTPVDLSVSFDLYDINTGAYANTSAAASKALNFIDVLRVTGRTAAGVTINPTFSNPCGTPTDEYTVGNTIKGNESCGSSTTIDATVSFSVPVYQVQIYYTPGTGYAGNLTGPTGYGTGWPQVTTDNPDRQYIDISPIRIGGAAAPSSVSGITNICSGTTTTLTAVGGNASSSWYTGSCGGTQIGTGASMTVAPTSNTTYFVANLGGCSGITSCATASVTVYGSTPSSTGLAANDYLWVSSASPTITIDSQGDTRCTRVGFGTGSANALWIGGTAVYNTGTTGATSANATYTTSITDGGTYSIEASIVRGNNRAIDVPYYIIHSGGTTTLSISQYSASASSATEWINLGNYTFNTGSTATVVINNGPMVDATKLAMADAIRFVKVGGSTDYELASNWLSFNGTLFSTVTSPPSSSNNVHIRPIGGCITAQPTVDNTITVVDAVGSANSNNITIANGATLNFSANNSHLHINGNYNNQGTVNPGTGRVKFIKSGAQTITDASGTANFYEMNVAGTSTVVLSSSVTVTNAIRLNGVITTGTNRVYLNTTALDDGSTTGFVSSNGHIFGNLRRRVVSNTSNYFFPVGVSNVLNTGRRLLVWMNNNVTGITDLDCSASNTFKGSGNNVDPRLDVTNKAKSYAQVLDIVRPEAEWTLTPNVAITGGNYGLQLYLQNFAAIPDNKFTIMKRPDASTDFFDFNTFYLTTAIPAVGAAGRIYSAGGGYAQKTGFTAFSKFVVATSAEILPIELVNYSIKCAQNKAILNWQTASESNNHYFTIWRSKDGISFDSLAFVYGAGNSNQLSNYSWTDNFNNDITPNPYYYYTISQTNFSGEKIYFDTKFFDKSCDLGINVFPNPMFDKGTLAFYINNNSMVSATLYNALGQLVKEYMKEKSFENGSHLTELNFEGMSSGIYYLNVNINNEVSTLKISVQKQ